MIHQEPVAPRALQPAIPRDLETICLKAMAKEKARRYRSAVAMAEDLERYLAGEPIEARPSTLTYRLVKRIKRNPWAWGATAAAVVAAVAVPLALGVQKRGYELSAEAREALGEADLALERWRMERYPKPHDVTEVRGQVEAAVQRLERVLEIEPEAHEARAKLGWAQLQLGRAGEAREALEKALSMADDGTYRWWLGRAYLKEYDERKVAAMQVEDPTERKHALDQAKEWMERAKEQVRAALSGAWSGEQWERELAEVFELKMAGKIPEAREACERLAGRAKGGEEGWMLLGQMEKRPEEMLEYFEKAIEHAPSWAAAYAAAARAGAIVGVERANSGGKPEQVDPVYKQAVGRAGVSIECDPTEIEGWIARGMARVNWGIYQAGHGGEPTEQYRRAIEEDFEQAIRLNPESAEAYRGRGMSRANWGVFQVGRGENPTENFRRAIEEDYEMAIGLNFESAEAHMSRGLARVNWGLYQADHDGDPTENFRRAIEEDYERAIGLNSESAKAHMGRGQARVNWGNYQDDHGGDPTEQYRRAIEEDYERAIGLTPESAEAHLGRGDARLNWGVYQQRRGGDPALQYHRAIDEDYARAIVLNPESSKAHMSRGNASGTMAAYLAGGPRATEARPWFARADESLTKAVDLNRRDAESRWWRGYWRLQAGRPTDALSDFKAALELNAALEPRLRPLIERVHRTLAEESEY